MLHRPKEKASKRKTWRPDQFSDVEASLLGFQYSVGFGLGDLERH